MSSRLLVVACCLAAAGGYLRLAASTNASPPESRLAALPLTLHDWRGRDHGRLDRETEGILQADAYLVRTYSRSAASVGLFVAYYATQSTGHTMHSPLNCLPGTGWSWTDRREERLVIDPTRAIEVNRNLAERNGERMLIYYWYQSRGRAVASDYRNKLLLVRDALTRHRSDGALIRVAAPAEPDVVQAREAASSFIRAVYPALTVSLPE